MMYSSVNCQLDCYDSKNYVILIMAGLPTLNFTINKAVQNSDTFDEATQQIDAELNEQPILRKRRSIREQLKSPRQVIPHPKKQKKKEYEH